MARRLAKSHILLCLLTALAASTFLVPRLLRVNVRVCHRHRVATVRQTSEPLGHNLILHLLWLATAFEAVHGCVAVLVLAPLVEPLLDGVVPLVQLLALGQGGRRGNRCSVGRGQQTKEEQQSCNNKRSEASCLHCEICVCMCACVRVYACMQIVR
ncbi:hypothetical protein GQ42DRAFT_46807 [Ramicandelaber brevisporus]|nr:hypothetical protein GQ42DRAFT_46807 [Ramicandelaber brevisporus]